MASGKPVIRRIDADHSSNGIFGLTVERIYVGDTNAGEGEDYADNTAGRTLLGPRWLLNWEIKLQHHAGQPALRTSEGMLVPFEPITTNYWRSNPQVMAACGKSYGQAISSTWQATKSRMYA